MHISSTLSGDHLQVLNASTKVFRAPMNLENSFVFSLYISLSNGLFPWSNKLRVIMFITRITIRVTSSGARTSGKPNNTGVWGTLGEGDLKLTDGITATWDKGGVLFMFSAGGPPNMTAILSWRVDMPDPLARLREFILQTTSPLN